MWSSGRRAVPDRLPDRAVQPRQLAEPPEERARKLLLHKREILKLGGRATEKGLTIVPLRSYLRNGRVKLEIGLGRGKKAHDKREAIKKKDIERETRQALRARR